MIDETPISISIAGIREDLLPQIIRTRETFLVRRHDVDPFLKENRVRISDILVGSIIHENDGCLGFGKVLCGIQ